MSDLKRYIKKRKAYDKEFATGYDKHYADFKIGVMVRTLRKESKLTQEELAKKMHTQKSAISRIENNSEDIRLSTLLKLAAVLGKQLHISIR
jgi:HTH-type transcriptional regulator / antitoxin HipB